MPEPREFAGFYAAELRAVLIFLVKQGATWEESWDAAQEAFYEALRCAEARSGEPPLAARRYPEVAGGSYFGW